MEKLVGLNEYIDCEQNGQNAHNDHYYFNFQNIYYES